MFGTYFGKQQLIPRIVTINLRVKFTHENNKTFDEF